MSTDIQVNDKAVCICDIPKRGRPFDLFNSVPKKGGIYCVSGVEESVGGQVIIELVGFMCREDENGDTYGFLAKWFRKIIPLSEREKEAASAKK